MSLSFSWSRSGDAQGAQTNGSAARAAPPTAQGFGTSSQQFQHHQPHNNGSAATAPPGATPAATQTVSVTDQLARVRDAWDPASPTCAFQHYFYNKIPAEQVALYQMPPGQDPAKWEKALVQRPDSTSVPVLAVGFDDLEKRIQQQKRTREEYSNKMTEIQRKLTEMQNRHDLNTTVKLAEMRERHTKLARRTLALAVKLQVLTHRGHALSSEEELFRRQLLEYLKRADDPTVFGSLKEVWARVTAADQQLVLPSESTDASEDADAEIDWDRAKEPLGKIVKILAQQQTGIKFLASVLEEDSQSLEKARENSRTNQSGHKSSADGSESHRYTVPDKVNATLPTAPAGSFANMSMYATK